MKKSKIMLCVGLIAALSGAFAAAIDFRGVEELAGRVRPDLAKKVRFVGLGADGDFAKIVPDAGGKTFTIQATSARMASFALGQYIRRIAKGHVSWCGNRFPAEWPMPTEETVVKPLFPLAIAYNYCTLSYTMAFWGKDAWQKEIDRLALQGYNIALMTAGLQKVWQLTLRELGYTEDQIRLFIADDAAIAWWHMGNIQGKGDFAREGIAYPVSDAQIDLDGEYGAWMVKAMRAVGIEPIFQGFVGLVPSTTTEGQFVGARIFRMGGWGPQKSPDILDPTCPAFKTVAACWYKNLKKVYGLTPETQPKYLGGDLFHENSPPKTMNDEQQRQCAVTSQRLQQEAFPGVVWVLQSWQASPVQNLRNGLDPAHTLIEVLDKGLHNTGNFGANYHNQFLNPPRHLPWAWVEVMNFGGNTGMHGGLRRFRNIGKLLNDWPHKHHQEKRDAFKGYGILSEGLETNPVSYDLFADAFAKPDRASQNLSEEQLAPWLEDYRLRRYGYTDDDLTLAQHICSTSVWDCALWQEGCVESVLCANPSYKVTSVSTWGPKTGTAYPRKVLVEAARHFLASAKRKPALLKLETFRYDFVEIFQQLLADKSRELLPSCETSADARKEFLNLIDLCDRILACSDDWRLDRKEARLTKAPSAKDRAGAVAAYRRMITTWTPGSWGRATGLNDYAHRSYAGLMRHYHLPLWRAFFAIKDGTMTPEAYRAFLAKHYVDFPKADLPPTPTDGDPVAIAGEILAAVE